VPGLAAAKTADSARPRRQAAALSTQGIRGRWPLRAPHANGGKYWRYKYRYGRKEKTLSLGIYPDVPAESAKARHRLARRLLAAGIDPGLRKEQVRRCSLIEDD
jgi:Arm DNA-binding domain